VRHYRLDTIGKVAIDSAAQNKTFDISIITSVSFPALTTTIRSRKLCVQSERAEQENIKKKHNKIV